MKLKGWIQTDVLKYTSCDLIIKNGKIREVKFDGQTPLDILHYNSIVATDFEFEKHYDRNKAPYKSNYYIKYLGGSKKPLLIFLKLTILQTINIKRQLNKYLIQDRSLKLGVLKYIIISLIGFIGFIAGRYYDEIANTKESSEEAPNKEIIKSLEESASVKNLKKDSITVK